MGPKWDPNRIFDAEALRKPLGGLLERSWRPLEPKNVSLEASWSLLGVENGSQIGSESHLRRGSPQKVSWRPLGALLEPLGASWSRKNKVGIALGALLRLLGTL